MSRDATAHLLSSLCLTPMSQRSADLARDSASAITDWDSVFALGDAWGVAAAAMRNLSTLEDVRLPYEVTQRASATSRLARAEVMGKVLRVTGIVQQFEAAGADVVVLKGPATGVTAYGDPSLRDFADLDLLVKPSDIKLGSELLQTVGFERGFPAGAEAKLLKGGHALEFMHPTLKVELHTELLEKYLRVPLSLGDMWERSRLVRCADTEIRVLPVDGEMVFLSAHGAKHEWGRVRWICDVAQLALRLENEDVWRLAQLTERVHARKLLSLALQLAVDLLPIGLPASLDSLRRRHDTTSISRELLSRLRIDSTAPRRPIINVAALHTALPPLLFWMRARERVSDNFFSVMDLIRQH